jgi:hypothetical protein
MSYSVLVLPLHLAYGLIDIAGISDLLERGWQSLIHARPGKAAIPVGRRSSRKTFSRQITIAILAEP